MYYYINIIIWHFWQRFIYNLPAAASWQKILLCFALFLPPLWLKRWNRPWYKPCCLVIVPSLWHSSRLVITFIWFSSLCCEANTSVFRFFSIFWKPFILLSKGAVISMPRVIHLLLSCWEISKLLLILCCGFNPGSWQHIRRVLYQWGRRRVSI